MATHIFTTSPSPTPVTDVTPPALRRALGTLKRLPPAALVVLTENLIAHLDAIEGDPDAEDDDPDCCPAGDDDPQARGAGMLGLGDADDAEDTGDTEPSLGWAECDFRFPFPRGELSLDDLEREPGEAEPDADGEPALGWPASPDQRVSLYLDTSDDDREGGDDQREPEIYVGGYGS